MVLEPPFESLKVEETLGWRVFSLNGQTAKTLAKNDNREIAQLKNGKLIYVLKNSPELSSEEAELLKEILEEYRDTNNDNELNANKAFERFCEDNIVKLDSTQEKYLKKTIQNIIEPSGILTELLKDEDLEEIAVIGLGKSKPVYVFDSVFGWLPTNLYFSNNKEVKRIVNAMAGTIGRRITLQNPKLNAHLNDGSRLNACIEPASVSGPTITIRKFKKNPLTPANLIDFGTVSSEQMAFLWLAIQSDCSLLVCGNTGSGKTTLLNSLLNFCPASERIIIVEETPELNIIHKHQVKLATVEGLELGMQELIINTLRMRPDRVIVGEIRNKEEVSAFMDTLLAGQGKGTYATFHAQSSIECVGRLKNLGAELNDLNSIDLIITQKRWSNFSKGRSNEERKLIEIAEPDIQKNKINIRKLYSYNFEKNSFSKNNIPKKVLEKIFRTFKIKKKNFPKELRKRAKFLDSLHNKNQEEFFDEIQSYGKTA